MREIGNRKRDDVNEVFDFAENKNKIMVKLLSFEMEATRGMLLALRLYPKLRIGRVFEKFTPNSKKYEKYLPQINADYALDRIGLLLLEFTNYAFLNMTIFPASADALRK